MPSDAKARRAANKKKQALNRKVACQDGDGASPVGSTNDSVNGESTPKLMSANSSVSK